MPKKMWLILDGRGWTDPDDASVYEAIDQAEAKSSKPHYALRIRDKEWPDGVVYEYDIIKGELKNQRLIG